MGEPLKLGQMLNGRLGSYSLTSKFYPSVWKASDLRGSSVVAKSVNHWRLENERDVLLRYQSQSPYIRQLLDEVDPDTPSHALFLRWLDHDLLDSVKDCGIEGSNAKFVAKRVLEALQALHADGVVHCDVKPSNVLVNHAAGIRHISEAQLADFGSPLHKDSKPARDGTSVGTTIFRSPEVQLEMPWSISADIFSFGVMLVDAIYGRGSHLLRTKVHRDHEDYFESIIRRYHQCLGPFPSTYTKIADHETIVALSWIMDTTEAETLRPFRRATSKEISNADRDFAMRSLQHDPRDRPTAKELLEDAWFDGVP